MEKRLTFRSGRTLVTLRLLTTTALIAGVAFLIALLGVPIDVPVVALAAVIGLYLLIFGISPLLSEHWITRSRLILRQGWYFRAVLPFSDIETVSAADDAGRLRTPLGIGRPLGGRVIFVTGGRSNLVALRLREPRRFWQAFGLDAREIVFDVLDRDRFLATLGERMGLLTPVEADRARPELRD